MQTASCPDRIAFCARLGNLVDLAAEKGERAIPARIRQTEQRVADLRAQLQHRENRAALKRQLANIKPGTVREVRWMNAVKLRDGGARLEESRSGLDLVYREEGLRAADPEHAAPREVLASTVARVTLDPCTRDVSLRYRLPLAGVSVASPRDHEPIPIVNTTTIHL
jgi:hypothetical protein